MRIRACIENNALRLAGMDEVYQFAFMIGLFELKRDAELAGFSGTHRFDIGQSKGAIGFWLAGAKKIEVWTVQDKNMSHNFAPLLKVAAQSVPELRVHVKRI